MTRRAHAALLALALALIAAGCGGEDGTIEVSVVAAPGSDLLGRIAHVRATLGDKLVEADRDASGKLDLALDLVANGGSGPLVLEGFADDGERIAFGRSGPLPLSAIDATVTVYLGPPQSFAAAPVALEPARSQVGVAVLSFGVVMAGGLGADGPSAAMTIYNLYSHQLEVGDDLPAARAGLAAMASSSRFVYLLGGTDQAGDATADLWRFHTDVAPAGLYEPLAADQALARSNATAAVVAADTFLVSGDPGVTVDGAAGRAVLATGSPALDGALAALPAPGGGLAVLATGDGVGTSGAILYQDFTFSELAAPAELARTGHQLVTLPDGRVLTVGGEADGAGLTSAVVYQPVSQTFAVLPDFLSRPRRDAAAAQVGGYLVVAGGADDDGVPLADAEVFDATSLESLGTLDLVAARRGAQLAPLATGNMLLIGGTDETGAPVGTLELFTPAD